MTPRFGAAKCPVSAPSRGGPVRMVAQTFLSVQISRAQVPLGSRHLPWAAPRPVARQQLVQVAGPFATDGRLDFADHQLVTGRPLDATEYADALGEVGVRQAAQQERQVRVVGLLVMDQ